MSTNTLILAANSFLLVCTLSAFIVGAVKYFKKKKPLFLQIVTCALGCASLGQISLLIRLFIGTANSQAFQVDVLGLLGCYFFLFSASFGQIDGLGDSRDKHLKKYRMISLLAPLTIILPFALILFSRAGLTQIIINGVLFALIAITSYFNLKHLILPDIENGILKSIRSYNLVVLLLSGFTVLRSIAEVYQLDIVAFISMICCGVLFFLIIILAGNGVKKWFL